MVVGSINEGGEFGTAAFWKVDCKEGTQIESSLTYGDYTPVELIALPLARRLGCMFISFGQRRGTRLLTGQQTSTASRLTKTSQLGIGRKLGNTPLCRGAKMPEPEQEQAE